jgi:hypothetical protein
MADTPTVYTTRVSGLWNSRHELRSEGERLGVLSLQRGAPGLVTSGEYRPEKGEVLSFRRDPGLLRSQFSMWTDGHEWLGSSLRWSFVRREITIHNGGKPFRLLPLRSLQRGWSLYAPRTGENARLSVPLVGRSARLAVFRRVDFPLLVFTYFLGCQLWGESLWPGPSEAEAVRQTEASVL